MFDNNIKNMVPRYTEFYIPVLTVLSDEEKREVNKLIEEVAEYVGLTPSDKEIQTKSGNQPRYRSNIQWAITDLCQAGFINRAARGVYDINAEGLAMLDDEPEHPDRNYLALHSENFREFLSKKGTRSSGIVEQEELPFYEDGVQIENNMPDENLVNEAENDELSLEEFYQLQSMLKRAKMPTMEVDNKIKILEAKINREKLYKSVKDSITEILKDIDESLEIIIRYKPNENLQLTITRDTVTSNIVKDSIYDNKNKNKKFNEGHLRKKNSTLIVRMPNGTILKDASAAEILEYVVQYVGTEKVERLGLVSAGMPLVSKTRPSKYSYRELSNGYFLTTNSNTKYKKQFIEEIAKSYNLDIKVEIIY